MCPRGACGASDASELGQLARRMAVDDDAGDGSGSGSKPLFFDLFNLFFYAPAPTV